MSDNFSNILFHGGDLDSASREFGIPVEEWIDLSTGINPVSYPVRDLPQSAFSHLPYLRADLLDAAKIYYGNVKPELNIIPVPGSQAAIQALPYCLPYRPVLLPNIGYSEHQSCWQARGVALNYYPSIAVDEAASAIDQAIKKNSHQHIVIINPNNPTALLFEVEQIRKWATTLSDGSYLIIDEAFIDLKAENSIVSIDMPTNVIVLRSFGKLFGLAGIRLGFLIAPAQIVRQVQQLTGLWSINGPAQFIATQALLDLGWQRQAIANIELCSNKTLQLISPLIQKVKPLKECHATLFTSYLLATDLAEQIYVDLARQGVLLRLIQVNREISLLRVGIIDGENTQQVERLAKAISSVAASF